MKLAIRINNHEWELSFKHSNYGAALNPIPPPSLEEILAKYSQEPDNGFILTPVPVINTEPVFKADVSSDETVHDSHIDETGLSKVPEAITTEYLDEILTTNVPIVRSNYTPCPCLKGPKCVECTDAIGNHSGGCLVQYCMAGLVKIFEPCYCTQPGYVMCFECNLRGEHSLQCTNCPQLMDS